MAKSILQSVRDAVLGQTVMLNLSGFAAVLDDSPGELTLLNLNAPQHNSVALAVIPPAPPKEKSVDMTGFGVTALDLGGSNAYSDLLRKQNIQLFRNYAKYSVWVRAAIDYYRRMLGRSAFELTPVDSQTKPSRRDKQVKANVELLIRHPNVAGESYGMLKEQVVEDYLVVGHGCMELDLNRDLTVRGMRIIDAAKIGFVKKWDGTDPSQPRFCEYKDANGSIITRYLANEQLFCLINRPQSDTKLGFSHVEALNRAVIALLSGDEWMIKQLLQPMPDSLLNLGEGVNKQQVEEFKYQIQQVRDKLAVIGGTKSAQVIRLSGTAEEMQILDGSEWFVRQVAAIFGISTAKLKLSVDLSRSNGETMMDDDLEMITGELTRIEELETATFIDRYSYMGEINLEFSYPIMQRKDEKEQAGIARTSSGRSFISLNEARIRTGEKPLDQNQDPFADEVIIDTPDGPLPRSVWSKKIQDFEKKIGKEPDPGETLEPAPDNPGDPNQDPTAEEGGSAGDAANNK